MTDQDSGFRIHRHAGGRIPSPRQSPEVFPVVVTQGVTKFQRKTVDKPRRWITVCVVPNDRGRKNLTNHYGSVLGRTEGKDFRFITQAK